MIRSHLSEIELVEYADGELSGSRLSRAQEHLRRCRTCAGALEALQDASDAVQTVTVPAAPRDLRAHIVARVAASPAPAISCRKALPLIHESLDEDLSPLAAGLLRLHLDTCLPCRREYADLCAATKAVRSLPTEAAPAWIRQAAYASTRAGRFSTPWSVRLRPALAATAMAAGALLVMLHHGQQSAAPVGAVRPAPVRIAAQPAPRPAPVAPVKVARLPQATPAEPPAVTSQPAPQDVEKPVRAVFEHRAAPALKATRAVVSQSLVRPQPSRRLVVHYAAPEPVRAPADKTPQAFQAIHSMTETPAKETTQHRMELAAEPFRVFEAENQGFPKLARTPDTEIAPAASQPAPGNGPGADDATSGRGKSANGVGLMQAA